MLFVLQGKESYNVLLVERLIRIIELASQSGEDGCNKYFIKDMLVFF